MFSSSFIMANKRFSYFIISAFVIGTLLLLVIQYNFSQNMKAMRQSNNDLLRELRTSNHLREIDRDLLGVESRIRAAIATDDTSHLEGVESKIKMLKGYLDSIKSKNDDSQTRTYLDRLDVIANEKVRIKNLLLKRYATIGNMNDTSLIANPGARRISDEITNVTHKIFDSRQKLMIDLSNTVEDSGEKARLYSNVITALILLSGAVFCWFVFNQFKQQNSLIVKLDVSEKTAIEALQVKENFLANMSHEIRTPLNAILGFTNLLKKRKIDNDTDELVGMIQKAGENLLAIINDILDLSKIEAGMMRIVKTPFSVRGLLQSVETLFSERVKEKGLSFSHRIDQDVPDTLIGDATRLTQILVNLIGNALKFSERGEINITIYNNKTSGDLIHLGIKIRDNGIGISKDKLDGIFERFNQAEESITRNYGGTGLGLAIVKNLVIIQNGQIEVSSQQGEGTEFHFIIPYTVAKDQLTDLTPVESTLPANTIMATTNILVVDDNQMNQSLMKHLLTQWNTGFDIVANGAEAISALKQKSYDVVLMDIQMPVMDGYTATGIIRSDLNMDIPIIAMTAHAMAGEREKCISNGMNDYISKPINEQELLRVVSRFVTTHGINQIEAPAPALPVFQYINLTYMKEISRGNIDYEKTVTQQFIQNAPKSLAGLQTAFDNNDLITLSAIAHDLKTTVAIMGLLPATEEMLEALEFPKPGNADLKALLGSLKHIGMNAVWEAEQFYNTL